MHPMLNIAIRTARKAGDLAAKYYEISSHTDLSIKGTNDFVANINIEAERLIISTIKKTYPKSIVLSKLPNDLLTNSTEAQWIVEPIGGLSNFQIGFPHFAVSIAARIRGRTEIAVVYDPMRNELFTATRGEGAQLNGYRLRCSKIKELHGALLATRFPTDAKHKAPSYFAILDALFKERNDFRCSGTTALDLCYVASGRVDGCFEIGFNECSVIASELIVREAGGLVTDFSGGHSFAQNRSIVAGNPRIVKGILGSMRHELNQMLTR